MADETNHAIQTLLRLTSVLNGALEANALLQEALLVVITRLNPALIDELPKAIERLKTIRAGSVLDEDILAKHAYETRIDDFKELALAMQEASSMFTEAIAASRN